MLVLLILKGKKLIAKVEKASCYSKSFYSVFILVCFIKAARRGYYLKFWSNRFRVLWWVKRVTAAQWESHCFMHPHISLWMQNHSKAAAHKQTSHVSGDSGDIWRPVLAQHSRVNRERKLWAAIIFDEDVTSAPSKGLFDLDQHGWCKNSLGKSARAYLDIGK